jgi:hypothetical protein
MSNLIHVSNFGKKSMVYSNEFGFMPLKNCTRKEFKASRELARYINKCGGWRAFKSLAAEEIEEAKASVKAILG